MTKQKTFDSMLWWLDNAKWWLDEGTWSTHQQEFVSHSLKHAIRYAKQLKNIVGNKSQN